MRILVIGLLSLLAFGSAFGASDFLARTLTPEDRARLATFAEVRERSVAAAGESDDAPAVQEFEEILAGEPQPILGVDIRGDYRCRFAKLDGILPLVVYGWFECVIGEDDIGYRFEKTSGSQRLTGHFVDDSEKRLVFYGAGHYRDEKPRAYGEDPERNIVGRFVKVGGARFRLELPLPNFESRFDILELEKRK